MVAIAMVKYLTPFRMEVGIHRKRRFCAGGPDAKGSGGIANIGVPAAAGKCRAKGTIRTEASSLRRGDFPYSGDRMDSQRERILKYGRNF